MSAKYENITLTINDLDRIKLPKFQRGFVWTSKKKNDFVETLHKGFPFGALLVYPESQEADSKLILLDGQQRLSTIQQYKRNPLMFWKPLNNESYKEALYSINELLSDEHKIDEKKFDKLVNGEIELADWADDVEENDKMTRKKLRSIVEDLRAKIGEYVDLDSLSILAIKFIGSRDNIAEVFANLNKGGVPLSKYEIYNAAWTDTEIRLLSQGESKNQDQILAEIKDYYNNMEGDAEFELNDFSEDELSRDRAVNLSEFGYALGAFVSKKLSALVASSSSTRKEIGFGLLGIITNIDNRQLHELNKKTDEIADNLEYILEKVDTICGDLQSAFSKLLGRMMAKKSDQYMPGLTSSFKTLSYFAALWDLDPEGSDYRKTLANIPSYYVYDYWAGNWTSHGDQRLLAYYPKYAKRNYLQRLSLGQMRDAYTRWAGDTTPSINFSKEVKALTTIHANLTYLSQTIAYGETFELEHIIAKKLINDADDASNRKVFAGSLGNCMYLPKSLNNKKKEKNLYDTNQDGAFNHLIESSLYFTEEEFEEITLALSERRLDEVNSFISSRGEKVAKTIAELLLKEEPSI